MTASQTLIGALGNVSVLIVSAFLAGIIIPKILLISFRKKLFDEPDERKIHQSSVPRLGGIAFKPVIFFSVALVIGISSLLGYESMGIDFTDGLTTVSFALCSLILVYIVGIADDLIGIRYAPKFVVQIMCGLLMIGGNLSMSTLGGVLGITQLPAAVGWVMTVFLVVFVINAINLIDGIDGLASGLTAIVMLFYGAIFFLRHDYFYSLIAFATLGVLIPFFYYNVFGNPAKGKKIFMGDTGSLTIGMVICILSLKLLRSESAEPDSPYNALVMAYSPLIVPCFDVVRVYLHRTRHGKNPFLPDMNHIHHKLLAVGLRQRAAMISILCVSAAYTLGNILLSPYVNVNLLLLLDVAIWTVANVILSKAIEQRKRSFR